MKKKVIQFFILLVLFALILAGLQIWRFGVFGGLAVLDESESYNVNVLTGVVTALGISDANAERISLIGTVLISGLFLILVLSFIIRYHKRAGLHSQHSRRLIPLDLSERRDKGI